MERLRLKGGNDDFILQTAVRTLEASGVIIYPTDTVYGLGALATDEVAVAKIHRIKTRDAQKPILALVADMDMLERYAVVTDIARKLSQAFLPGPLSLILTARGKSLAPVLGEHASIGFRFAHTGFLANLVRTLNAPITSTSVNRSGEPPVTSLDSLEASLGLGTHHISLVVDAGILRASEVSTIVDVRGERAVILRDGAIGRDLLGPFL